MYYYELHRSKTPNSMSDIYNKSELTDVTLSGHGDGDLKDTLIQIKAHKVILAQNSPVLRHLINNQMNNIYVKGVKGSILKAIVDFIYKGSVNLDHNGQVKDFLDAAKDLKVKGIEDLVIYTQKKRSFICDEEIFIDLVRCDQAPNIKGQVFNVNEKVNNKDYAEISIKGQHHIE